MSEDRNKAYVKTNISTNLIINRKWYYSSIGIEEKIQTLIWEMHSTLSFCFELTGCVHKNNCNQFLMNQTL